MTPRDPVTFDEHWRPIEGWPYQVSDDGRVARAKAENNTYVGKLLEPNYTKDGYRYYVLCRNGKTRTLKAHALVALAFVGPRPSGRHQVRHLDGCPSNNHYTNLTWGTAKQNAEDRDRHGRTPRGETSVLAVLTNDQVTDLRMAYARHLEERKRNGFERARRGFVRAMAAQRSINHNTLASILMDKGYATP